MSLDESLDYVPIFHALSEAERKHVIKLAIKVEIPPETTLFQEGEYWKTVMLIAEGSMRSYLNAPNGRNYVVHTWKKGELFWPHSIFDDMPMPSTMVTTGKTTVYQWNGEELYEFMLRSTAAVKALMQMMAKQIRKRRQSIYELAFSPVGHRLAGLIRGMFHGVDVNTVQRELTLDEMAEMVATSPEVVCRLLYHFQSKGIISVNRATITLNDPIALEEVLSE